MTTAPPVITTVIAEFEAELREIETRGGLLRETIASLRQIWDVSPLASSAIEQASAPLVQSAKPEARAASAEPAGAPKFETYKRTKRAPDGDRAAQMASVLQVAASLSQPFSSRDLHQRVTDIPFATLQGYLSAFIAAGAITKTGTRVHTRYTVSPRVDASKLDGLASKALPAPTKTSVSGDELAQAVKRIMASGASYEVRELVKKLRSDYPDIQASTVTGFMENLVSSRVVERIAAGFGGEPRYRKRAA